MRALSRENWFFGLVVVLAGCAGVGVVATSDPAAKLHDAGYLYDRADRPLIAERLIREAIEIYEKNNDQLGLAEAYLEYGFFFRSRSIEGKWNTFYRENGFLDKSASFDTRYAKSIEYFERARAIFSEYKRFDVLTNVNHNMGFTYELMGNSKAACAAFERALESNRENLRQNPTAKVNLPPGVATYEDYLAPHRKRAGCS
jgi:tetratricopeptide (TPR) repeat protein